MQLLSLWTIAIETAKKIIVTGLMAVMIVCGDKLMDCHILIYEQFMCVHKSLIEICGNHA